MISLVTHPFSAYASTHNLQIVAGDVSYLPHGLTAGSMWLMLQDKITEL
jgi:hypothetical protein